MRIAFYAPLKSPSHPVPSGDRLMARMLMRALELGGHRVEVASEFRSYAPSPTMVSHAVAMAAAEAEITRLSAVWREEQKPDLWFCYHPYYKAPDLIGPGLAKAFAIPYVTVEASYSPRRNTGIWAETQARLAETVAMAALNICFTGRDREGLARAAPAARFATLAPFIDVSAFSAVPRSPEASRLVTVAMMRPGDKMDSYRILARALELLPHLPWTLSVIGDGPCRAATLAEFASIAPERLNWLGERKPVEVASLLGQGGLYVWPGCGEAYGLAYLEAQASGLPVVAQNIAGVPEVVRHSETGILTPPGDIAAYAQAIGRLLTNDAERRSMAASARRFVLGERSLDVAARHLSVLLAEL